MTTAVSYGTIDSEADVTCVATMIHHAFAGPVDRCAEWMRKGGIENLRVLRVAEAGPLPVACLLRIPMAQYFGGRAVRMLGVAGVASRPQWRGRGYARAMMQAFVREAAADGFAISTLYPSTQKLYRPCGYEQAGFRFRISIPASGMSGGRRALAVRPLGDDDLPAVRRCYSKWAVAHDGMLERGPYVWERIRTGRDITYEGFGAFDAAGELAGYLYLNQDRDIATGRYDLVLSDLAWTTPAAGRTLQQFLADFSTMADDVVCFGHPAHPLIFLLDGVQYEAERKDYWMLRMLDVRAALLARGYARSIRASCSFIVRDPLLPSNDGALTLHVADGVARIEPGAAHDPIRTDIRGFAAVYSGFLTPARAAQTGAIEGSEAALAACDGVFANGGPAMPDMF